MSRTQLDYWILNRLHGRRLQFELVNSSKFLSAVGYMRVGSKDLSFFFCCQNERQSPPAPPGEIVGWKIRLWLEETFWNPSFRAGIATPRRLDGREPLSIGGTTATTGSSHLTVKSVVLVWRTGTTRTRRKNWYFTCRRVHLMEIFRVGQLDCWPVGALQASKIWRQVLVRIYLHLSTPA